MYVDALSISDYDNDKLDQKTFVRVARTKLMDASVTSLLQLIQKH